MECVFTRTCQACGMNNPITANHLADSVYCGACRAVLAPMSEPLNVTADEFTDIVSRNSVPILVDFWAAWCGPCHMAAPGLRKLAAELAGRALVLKVNTEESPELAARFGVCAIPNFVVMRGGKPVMQRTGVVDHRQMRTWLEQASQVN